MDRRGFLAGILTVAVAPAIVKPASLMSIWTPKQEIAYELDAYEEGTFTPMLKAGDHCGIGTYTRIGNKVMFQVKIVPQDNNVNITQGMMDWKEFKDRML